MSEYNELNDLEPEKHPDGDSSTEPASAGSVQKPVSGENTQASMPERPSYGWRPYQNQTPQQNSGWYHGSAPNQQGRYGAPYSPNYGNAYPPRRDGNDVQPGYRPPQGEQQGTTNPYPYNASQGWQQRQPEKYEWKFEDYDKLDRKKERKPRNRGLVVFTVLLVAFFAVGLIGVAGYGIWSAYQYDNLHSDGEQSSVSDSSDPSAGDASEASSSLNIVGRPQDDDVALPEGKMTIPQVAEAVLPSVVGVIKYDNGQYFEISGYGSGIIMSEDGYIVTNAHVVAGGTGFKVQLTDGEAFDAQLVGYDLMTDLAVIKVDVPGLVPAQFGDSDAMRVGETVVAIGNPGSMELAGSVTSGIVSAVNREVRTANYTMNYIQTDAAINPGNSGGALANEYGQVIGINSAKIAATDYEGIGFAIPVTVAKPVIDDIIQNGRVTGRVMLGITSRKVVDEVDARNYQIQMGPMVDSIQNPDLLAGGVQAGDIITHIDGERVYNVTDVSNAINGKEVGDVVTVTFYRKIGARETTFNVEAHLLESE